MSNNENQFDFDPELGAEIPLTPPVALSPPTALPQNPPTPQPQGAVNVQHIDTRRITGPLVVFFGPREIGKTVTLLRLCRYIRGNYQVRPDQSFRTDNRYSVAVTAFEEMMENMQFAPAGTGNIDFLLLDITHNGNSFCQILESPGEHFFDRIKPNEAYPNYMNKILSDDYKKVFVFFFELNMFKSDDDLRSYADKIARLVNEKVSPRRDQIIILCNKCDIQPHFKGGMPIKSEFKNRTFNHPSFKLLKDALIRSDFKHVPFVPFSAGAFNDDGTGRLVFAPSPDHYAKELWNQIYESIQGRPWWKIL